MPEAGKPGAESPEIVKPAGKPTKPWPGVIRSAERAEDTWAGNWVVALAKSDGTKDETTSSSTGVPKSPDDFVPPAWG
jgi:hypothetical protein